MSAGPTAAQRRAADPERSIWAAASAGSGKTSVLANRVLALLLDGIPAARILCLTFTKAAAGEMANRVLERLAQWSRLDDAELAQALNVVALRPHGPAELRRARGLFAAILDLPGGLNIKTIHGFAESLLKRFPIEAGIAPHFGVLDAPSATALRKRAFDHILAALGNPARDPLAADFERLAATGRNEAELIDLIARLPAERAVDAERRVEQLSGGRAQDTPARILAEASRKTPETRSLLAQAVVKLGASKAKTDRANAELIARFLECDCDPSVYPDYRKVFLTKDGTRRVRIVTEAFATAEPELAAWFDHEADAVAEFEQDRRRAETLADSLVLLRFGGAVNDAYRALKRGAAALDYDDLIAGACALLEREGGCSWVMYKLDGGIDHILVDEAQDTSAAQWRVIEALSAEFFAGDGAASARRRGARTLFVVGDDKQSIFGFQGADPEGFAAGRARLESRTQAAGLPFDEVALSLSFRSAPAILDVVDAVFQTDDQAGAVRPRHQPFRAEAGGLVELWPLAIPTADAPEPEPWAIDAADRLGDDPPENQLARMIAGQIAGWIERGERLESHDRPIRAGDVLILLRRRGGLMGPLIRAIKQRHLPLAGADRLVLSDHLAVMDLIALGQFLLLPDDDLTLATVLKSPLIGFDDESLEALALGRSGRLWHALSARATERPAFAEAHAALAHWLDRVDYAPPYALYAEILASGAPLSVRDRLIGRLGPDSADPIDEFLEQCLAFERQRPPSLQGFLHWLERGAVEIKRDSAAVLRDEIRIMTVHGAKGLEAPIVILPDTIQTDGGGTASPPLFAADGSGPLWAPRKNVQSTAYQRLAQDRAAAEAREAERLLYVAMTRAEDRLYIGGYHGRRTPGPESWYQRIAAALGALPGADRVDFDFAPLGCPDWRGEGLRYHLPCRIADRAGRHALTVQEAAPDLPAWAKAEAPREKEPGRRLAPSRLGAEPPVQAPVGPEASARFKRGRLIHTLLQYLPEIAPEERRARAATYLAKPAHQLSDAAQQEIAAACLWVLEDPGFAAIFAPGSIAEMPIAGQIGAHVIAGQIDRAVITPARILIVDYKTNRLPPATVDAVADAYLAQMAAYRFLLAEIFPDRSIHAALLWTAAPAFMPLPDTLLDQRMAALRGPQY